jgi:hypothetical protein
MSQEIAKTRAQWADEIIASAQKTIESYLETGRLLIAAKEGPDKLPHGEFLAMIETDLPFGARTAQQLMTIARDQRIANHGSHLPTRWRTLFVLTRLPDDVFARGIESGEINPTITRADATRIVRVAVTHQPGKAVPSIVPVYATTEPKPPPKMVTQDDLNAEQTEPAAPAQSPPRDLKTEIETLNKIALDLETGNKILRGEIDASAPPPREIHRPNTGAAAASVLAAADRSKTKIQPAVSFNAAADRADTMTRQAQELQQNRARYIEGVKAFRLDDAALERERAAVETALFFLRQAKEAG